MSEGLNKCMLLGNLCADPELRYTQAGVPVLSMRLATNERYLNKDKQWQERVDFHSVVVWSKRGEALSKILHKGSSIFVEGSIRTSSYDDRDGNKRYKTEIIANNVLLPGGRGGGGGDDARGYDGPGDSGPTSGPQRGGGGRPSGDHGGQRQGQQRHERQGGRSGGGGGGRGRQEPQGAQPAEDDYSYEGSGGGGGGGDDDIPFLSCAFDPFADPVISGLGWLRKAIV
jgi:single-strand DNA-binding protein